MKKLSLFLIAAAILVSCKSKKSASATPSNAGPTETQLTAVKAKYPDATMETLKQGHTLYYSTCTNCHAAKDIHSRDEEKWPGIIDRMAKKAGISDTEKDAVLKYVMSVKLASK
jgi:cytochrome c5